MIAVLASHLFAASSDSGPVWLLILGPAAGGGMYYGLWQYYRNTGKSHSFERETRVQAKQVTGNDRKVDEIKGTRESRIQGDNLRDYRKRVQRIRGDSS